MVDFTLPQHVIPNEADWTLVDFTGAQQSPLSGAVRTVSRGQRWKAHYVWHDVRGDDRAALIAFISAMQGMSNRCWVNDPSYVQRGSFSCPELMSNPLLASGSTGYSVSGNGAISGYNGALRLDITGTATPPAVYQSISVTTGLAYALRSCILDGLSTSTLNAGVQLADTGHTFPSIGTSRGLITSAAAALATGAANQNALILSAGGGLAIGQFLLCTYASLRRCALAVNPSATVYGTMLPCDALPVSTQGLLRAGDRIEVNGEHKVLTQDLNSDSTGYGILVFQPALRKVVPDNAPVITGAPMMRAYMGADAFVTTRPGGFSDIEIDFVEA